MRRYIGSLIETLKNYGFKKQFNPNKKELSTNLFKDCRHRKLGLETLEDRRVLAVLTVNSNLDSVAGDNFLSLREAIAVVNDNDLGIIAELGRTLTAGENSQINTFGGAQPLGINDTVVFDSMLHGQTILLVQGTALAPTRSIIINGPGADLLTIDAAGNDSDTTMKNGTGTSVFGINISGNTSTKISGLTLQGGDRGGQVLTSLTHGGAIQAVVATGGMLELSDLIIQDNHSVADGGGIGVTVNDGGIFNLSQSIVKENSALFGGGISLRVVGETSRATVETVVVDSNFTIDSVVGDSGRDGGGIIIVNGELSQLGFSAPGIVTISSSRISNNVAGSLDEIEDFPGKYDGTGSGGGIYASTLLHNVGSSVLNARTIILDSEISNNIGTKSGGGIEFSTGLAELSFNTFAPIVNSTISGNQATTGGGIYFVGDDEGFTNVPDQMILRHSTVTNNIAGGLNTALTPGFSYRGGGGISIRGPVVIGTGGPTEILEVTLDHSIISGNSHVCDLHNECSYRWTYESPDVGVVTEIDAPPTPVLLKANYTIVGTDLGPIAGGTDPSGQLVYKVHLDGTGNQVNVNPLLGPLADNGGYLLPDGTHVLTHALRNGSPAIDAGDMNAVAGMGGVPHFDQRGPGFTRVFEWSPGGIKIDIGAYERQQVDPAVFDADFEHDGDVDGNDFLIWQRNFGVGMGHAEGDADFDLDVDGDDLAIWRDQYGLGLSGLSGLTLDGVAIEGNSAYFSGGGIYTTEGNSTSGILLKNSTISTNSANSYSSGIVDSSGGAAIVNSTITLNTSTYSVGSGVFGSGTWLANTIVAGNSNSSGPSDLSGSFSSNSRHNFIGYDPNLTNGINDDGGTGNMNQVGESAAIDGMLSTLDYWGGSTKTHKLLEDSDAINAGDNALVALYGLEYDQRGFDRIADNNFDLVDIGAIESAFEDF